MNPRGFFRPESSVSSACSVPWSPPPPIMPIGETTRSRPGSGATGPSACLVSTFLVSPDRYVNPWQPSVRNGAPTAKPPPPGGPCWASAPRRPSESASSKKTITPPYLSASLRSFLNSDFTFRMPMPMNMLTKAPGSTKTYGRPVSPATASAISVLPVPGGPHRSRPLGTYPPLSSISSGFSRKTMFSFTRSTTWSWPHTSENRVLMSSGK